MVIGKNTLGIALIVSIVTFVSDIITSALGNLVTYGWVLGIQKIFAPDYKAILMGVIIVIIMGIVTYLAINFIPKKNKVKSVLISVLILGISIGILIGMVISPFPLFEITSPTDNSVVDHVISVRGHGGIPNSEIKVFVITNYLYPQDQKTHPDATGKWTVYPVYIGEEHQYGIEADIYAEMTTPDGKVYKSNFIKGKRKDE